MQLSYRRPQDVRRIAREATERLEGVEAIDVNVPLKGGKVSEARTLIALRVTRQVDYRLLLTSK